MNLLSSETIDELCIRLKLDRFGDSKYVKMVSEKTKFRPTTVLFTGFVLAVLFFLFSGMGRGLIEGVLLFLYPATKTYQAIKAKTGTASNHSWVAYWFVFGLLFSPDLVWHDLVHWIPLWRTLRILALSSLMHPKVKGTSWVFHNVLVVMSDKYEKLVDELFGVGDNKFSSLMDKDENEREAINILKGDALKNAKKKRT